jgi:hypothetical protein
MILENNNKSKWPSNVWFNGILCASLNIVPALIHPFGLVLSATASAVFAYHNLCDLGKDKASDQNDNDNDHDKKINLWLSRVGGIALGISLATFIIALRSQNTSTLTPIPNAPELANPSTTVSLVLQPLRQLS